MFVAVLPLRAVMFQILFLLISIALESWFLRHILNLSPKRALEYSASLNIFSMIAVWLLFFTVKSILPDFLGQQLINYIFFNTFVPTKPFFDWLNNLYLILFRLWISFLHFGAEILALEFLLKIYIPPPIELQTNGSPANQSSEKKRAAILTNNRLRNQLFQANFTSATAIMFILLFTLNFP